MDGRYEVVREIGRGASGRVLLATDVFLRRPVALKVFIGRGGADRSLAVLQREAASLCRVRSPNVVGVYAFGLLEDGCYFAMEYVRGRTLGGLLDEHHGHDEHLPLLTVATLVDRVAKGLDEVHAHGLVHRDVKPSNIVVEDDTGRPVLVDFGLALPTGSGPEGLIEGSPAYLSPEQASGGRVEVGPRADQYSLACAAYELLTGDVPFDGRNTAEFVAQHLTARPPPLSSRRARLGPVDAVMAKALSKSPDDRFQSSGLFGQALSESLLRIPGVSTVVSRLRVPLPTPSGSIADDKLLVVAIVPDPETRKTTHRAVQVGMFRSGVEVRSYADPGAFPTEGRPPDLLILDTDLPRSASLDFVVGIRSRVEGSRMRVVLVGPSGDTTRWRFGVLGIDCFLAKPLDFSEMVDAIAGLAERAGWKSTARDDDGSVSR